MTQEEIEALMSGTVADGIDTVAESEPEVPAEESIDDILAGIDGVVDDAPADESPAEENIDDILAGIDGVIDDGSSVDDEVQNMDDILAGIDGIVDNEPAAPIEPTSSPSAPEQEPEDLSSKIDEGIYPLPVEKEHKVVNQLNEVAEDSEEKASQIFDVLSYILDQNDLVQRNNSQTTEFIDSQIVLLDTLSKKFPNVAVFEENMQKAQEAKTAIDEINNAINDENNKVFEAMELMQFHDINRQKIERVMSVIKKLSNYLNGLFEDDSSKPEVQIAKHISGDSSESVTEDDLDSLISEFSQE
jgi:hypothetical protein